ncbi:MAG: flotillin-like protein FloA [Verrucomicrobiales bacterium]|nr:flotillin-like protein FloA [Verrucomicrobiales bacterium]
MQNLTSTLALTIAGREVSGFALAALIALLIVGFVVFIVVINFFSVWIRALFSGARVTFTELIALRLRKVPVGLIVDSRITAVKSGLDVTIDDLSTHYLAGGSVEMVVLALIAARKAGIHLVFDRACAIDLATKGTGKTVLEAVKTSVNPKVIDCPNPASGRVTIDGVAKDGIVVKAKARVTVRTNLERFVGGATEETIIARVGEGIVTTIGSSLSYKDVLENPDRISKTVLDKALDSNTAFEILSIDIADIDVGENVGAKLQAEQAEANKLIAQAQAEVRRAAAVALEQEMLARVQEMRARVVEAEAQVPLAMADAFRSGNLGVMDYFKMKNVQADTSMRETIAGGAPGTTSSKNTGP